MRITILIIITLACTIGITAFPPINEQEPFLCSRACEKWICGDPDDKACMDACVIRCADDKRTVRFDTPPRPIPTRKRSAIPRVVRNVRNAAVKFPSLIGGPYEQRPRPEDIVKNPLLVGGSGSGGGGGDDDALNDDPLRDRPRFDLRKLMAVDVMSNGVIVDGTSHSRMLLSTFVAMSRGKIYQVREYNETMIDIELVFDFGDRLFRADPTSNTMPTTPEESRGFYGIDFHESYHHNGKFYITYAASGISPVSDNKVDHTLITEELRVADAFSYALTLSQTTRIMLAQPQTTSRRVGGYTQTSGSFITPSVVVATDGNKLSRFPTPHTSDASTDVSLQWGPQYASFVNNYQSSPLWMTLPERFGTIDACHRNRNSKTIACLTTSTTLTPLARQQHIIEIDSNSNINLVATLRESSPCRFASIISYSGLHWRTRIAADYFLLKPACYTAKSGMQDGGIYGLEIKWNWNRAPDQEPQYKLVPFPVTFERGANSIDGAVPTLGSRGVTILQHFIEGRNSDLYVSAIVARTYEAVLYRVMPLAQSEQ